jgi:hypothetical protein
MCWVACGGVLWCPEKILGVLQLAALGPSAVPEFVLAPGPGNQDTCTKRLVGRVVEQGYLTKPWNGSQRP